jgi:putative phage-type endonuclease
MDEMKQITGPAAVQGSEEWKELRKQYRTASEAAVVLGLSPFQKPKDLKMVKAGTKEVFYSKSMRLGNELEPVARKKAEDLLGEPFEPQVWVRGKYLASLDGISFDGKTIIEIKVSKHTFDEVVEGRVLEHYVAQVRQQAYCCGAEAAFLVSMHPETLDVAITQVGWTGRESDFVSQLDAAWDSFDEMDVPEEIDMNDSSEWCALADQYREARLARDQADAKLKEVKERMVDKAGGNASGHGVKLYHVAGRKSVAYAKALKKFAPDADLSEFETVGEPSWSVRIEK